MSQHDWPSSRARAPAFPWDAQPRAPARRGAPSLSDDDAIVAQPAKPALALVPVQFGVGAFRAPIPRAMLATAVPPGSFGRGGAACGFGAPCCGEASDAGESGATARSVFGFPAGGASAASVSVSQSCAAFGAGDDGAEVTSGAARAAAQHAAAPRAAPQQLQPLPQPLPQQLQRAPAHFFTQLAPPPGLEMYYAAAAAAAAPSQEQMAVDAAALVPCCKRSVPEQWVTVERPPRVYRGHDEDDMSYDQGPAVVATTVTREEVMVETGAADWSLVAHLRSHEREMLPCSSADAHDQFQPYDAEMHPMRRDHEHEE